MIVAWDNYALAAAATGQLKYRAAMGHKAVVLGVAALAPAENRSGLLAVLYNELCMCVEPHKARLVGPCLCCVQEVLGRPRE